MLIGFCGSIEQAELAKSCGFDYLEPGIVTICAMSEEEFAEKQAYLQRVGLPVLTANLFLPGDWPLGHAPLDEERNPHLFGDHSGTTFPIGCERCGTGFRRCAGIE